MIILGIETSCDETAASVVDNGTAIFSSVVSSQVDVHSRYGGVVPELASREHMGTIVTVVREAIRQSGIGQERLDAIAVTLGPGLVGCLLVGFSFAKAYAFGLGIPWTGVNHLEGHIHSVFLGPDPPPFPFISLLASGGHTGIYLVTSHTGMELLGQTRDDAAGEAFDKVAKMLGLGYPGGSIIGNLAEKGDPGKIDFPRPYLDKSGFDFSFSGIKTSVSRFIRTHSAEYKEMTPDIAAGFQEAVVDVLSYKLLLAAKAKRCKHVSIVGGVAANKRLREKIIKDAGPTGIKVHMPSHALCGDNAAMIAAAGYYLLINGGPQDLSLDVFSRAK
ncbi:MAG: tRNA (adenosine(37)-N6)-threonylcarbamoyltransferase complex transferase subunit TsaD [Desulfobacteraceae bacterium]|nr:MAG: tRNA (adenosine(37)-N6)-threonylcarbamoyltransferase complex transferase subunit TsaD [Desulfobacteraceae bacterium]